MPSFEDPRAQSAHGHGNGIPRSSFGPLDPVYQQYALLYAPEPRVGPKHPFAGSMKGVAAAERWDAESEDEVSYTGTFGQAPDAEGEGEAGWHADAGDDEFDYGDDEGTVHGHGHKTRSHINVEAWRTGMGQITW
jgi:hypothetical protein